MRPDDATDVLRVTDHGRVRLIAFDRPEVLNAFDTALYRATAGALDEARTEDAVHVAVLTGTGRAFSSGQDLAEMERLAEGVATGQTVESGFPALLDALQRFDKPLVAAVNGIGLGIGFTLLVHCDLVLMSSEARLRVPFAEMGVPPEAGSSYLLPARMGWQRAAHVLFTGSWLGADEAVESGIALRVVEPGALLDESLALAGSVADSPLAALRAIKSTMLAARADAVAAARHREETAFTELLAGFTRPS
jgi:enoyl-CoA hydratase/carnithine racemase